jgi:two-component system, LytTR family, response regulator
MPLRVVIADDEVLARQKLLQLLRDEADVEVVGEGANALETIDLVQFTQPDVLLLDVRMPGMDGFDVISALSSSAPLGLPGIIFTTAHDQYALKAFEVHAVDYLLKPFTRERLQIALQHARDQREHAQRPATGAPKSTQKKEYTNRLVFRSKGRILFLPIADIRWIGAEENYVRICAGKESHMLRNTMARGFLAGASLGDRKSPARERISHRWRRRMLCHHVRWTEASRKPRIPFAHYRAHRALKDFHNWGNREIAPS